tara:strand:- start:3574 stop:4092 length:519 start_codon:yes stop_codon:yes gene_type:complete
MVFNIGANVPCSILDETARKYFKIWEMACFSGFLTAREVALRMVPRGRGSIIFTGATASARGAAGFAAFAGAKHALRALAQSMARELGPKIFTLLMWSLMARWIPTLSANLWPANTNAACHSTAFLNPNTSLTTTGCCTGSHGTPGPSNWICVPIWKTGKSGKQIRTDMLLA